MCLARVWFPFNTNSLLLSSKSLHCILQHRQHTKTSWFFASNYSPHNASDTDTMCLRDALYAACNSLLAVASSFICAVLLCMSRLCRCGSRESRLGSLSFLLSRAPRAHITERRVENFDFDVEVKMLQAFCCRTSRRGNSNHCRLCFTFPFLELCIFYVTIHSIVVGIDNQVEKLQPFASCTYTHGHPTRMRIRQRRKRAPWTVEGSSCVARFHILILLRLYAPSSTAYIYSVCF